MLEYFYRRDEQEIFSARAKELSSMESYLLSKRPADIHLSGLRRIGKTILIKEFIKRHISDKNILPVYINLEEISETPEDFALKFVGWHVYWYYAKGSKLPFNFLHLPSLIFEVQDKELRESLIPLTQELEKARPDRQKLLQTCFGFSDLLSRLAGKRVMVFLDEFQEINNLTNFDQTKNILKLLRAAKDRSENVVYCISGSIISEMEHVTRDSQSPLFNQFTHIPIKAYTREETSELSSKFIADIDNRSLGLLHLYSAGNPFYLVHILRKLMLFIDKGEELSEGLVKRSFISETLSPSGMIHSYCNYLYSISLQRAKGYGVLKALLDIIATSEEALTQSELARILKMSQGAVRVNLKELQNVGLLFEKERKYHYIDSVLRYWVAYVQNGVEVSDFPKEKDLVSIIEEMDKKFHRVSQELGKAREDTIKDLMKRFAGQEIDGAIFGTSRKVKLPGFKKVERYISTDGKTEIDVLAENKVNWAVEIKWKGRAAGIREIEAFNRKASSLSSRLWFVSKAGFTEEARSFALITGIYLSSEKDITALQSLVHKNQ